jgi:hypothetical protein
MMGEDTTRNMESSFQELNKLCNVASRWKYIKMNILTMHGPERQKYAVVTFTVNFNFTE